MIFDECQLKQRIFRSLGALFDVNIDENKQIFEYAIEQANEKLLKEEGFQLEGEVAEIVYGNEVTISRGLCGLLEVMKKNFFY